jgi:hypothetical protein
MITLPTIHNNGTSADDLLEGNLAARTAIESALDVIRRMEFNARDYYPVPGSFEKARDERRVHIENLLNASVYFLSIAEFCSDAVAAKEARLATRFSLNRA